MNVFSHPTDVRWAADEAEAHFDINPYPANVENMVSS
jgi:hypothetical protein